MILSIHTPELFRAAVAVAAAELRSGRLVILPTETVYGLAANALDETAVAKIFQAKGRPPNNPIIVHIAGLEMAGRCAQFLPASVSDLARAFWPGPLTLVVPKSTQIPRLVTAGGDTVGLRWPSHPFILAVIQACDFPLAAPSANLANQLSPTSLRHISPELHREVAIQVDGGETHVGIESAVVDLTTQPPCLLRPGMISEDALRRIIPEMRSTPAAALEGAPLKSPGQLSKHYAPKARLEVLRWNSETEFKHQLSPLLKRFHRIHVLAHHVIPSGLPSDQITVIPHDPEAFARALYSELHRCDTAGADLILVESVPGTPAWRGILDRLSRAAGHS